MGDHDAEHGTSKASRSAERMIEERIDELRAIALGPVDGAAVQPEDSAPHSGADPDAAILQPVPPATPRSSARRRSQRPPSASPSPKAAAPPHAALTGARPTPPPPSTPIVIPQATGIGLDRDDSALAQLIAASVSRVEYSVQEDFSRLEELLRGWGMPSEQMLAGVQRMERSLRAEMARILELVHSVSVAPGVVANAIEASANQLEERSEQRFQGITTDIAQLTEAIREYGESVAKAAGSAGAIAGSGVADRVTKSIEYWTDDIADRMSDMRARIDALDSTLQESTETNQTSGQHVSQAVANGMGTVASAVTEGLDTVSDAVMAVERRLMVQMHRMISDEMTEMLASELNRMVAVEMKQVMNTALDRRSAITHKRFDEVNQRVDDLRQGLMHEGFDEIAKRIDVLRSSLMQQGFNELGRRLDTLHTTVIDKGFVDLSSKLDTLQAASIDQGFSDLSGKLESVQAALFSHGFDELSTKIGSVQSSMFSRGFDELSDKLGSVQSTLMSQGFDELAGKIDSLQSSLFSQGFNDVAEQLDGIRLLIKKSVEADLGTGEIVADSIGSVVRHLNRTESELAGMRGRVEDVVERVEGVVDQMGAVDTTLQDLDARVTGRVESLDERLTGRVAALDEHVTGRVEALDQHVAGRVEALDERVDRRLGQVSSALAHQISTFDARISDQISKLAQIEPRSTNSDGMSSLDRADLLTLREELKAAGGEQSSALLARIEELEETLLIVNDDLTDELGERIDTTLAPLMQRLELIEVQIARMHERVAGTSVSVSGSDVIDIEAFRSELLDQLDTGRVQNAQDIEMVLDGMVGVWQRMQERMNAADQQMAGMVESLDRLTAANAEMLSAVSSLAKPAPKKRATTSPAKTTPAKTKPTKPAAGKTVVTNAAGAASGDEPVKATKAASKPRTTTRAKRPGAAPETPADEQ